MKYWASEVSLNGAVLLKSRNLRPAEIQLLTCNSARNIQLSGTSAFDIFTGFASRVPGEDLESKPAPVRGSVGSHVEVQDS